MSRGPYKRKAPPMMLKESAFPSELTFRLREGAYLTSLRQAAHTLGFPMREEGLYQYVTIQSQADAERLASQTGAATVCRYCGLRHAEGVPGHDHYGNPDVERR